MTETVLKDKLQESLKSSLLKRLPSTSRLETDIKGFALTRYDEPLSSTRCFYTPMVALVVQGFKRSMIGGREANYGALHCVTVGIDMPGVFQISNASPEAPFLSMSMKLDRRIITQLLTEDPSLLAAADEALNPVVVDAASRDLLQTFVRLVELLDTPSRIPVLAPMLLRELHYYLLCGSQGRCLRLFSTTGTQANRIAEAISWLRSHYAESLNMGELAQRVNMAPSTFNRHFKQVTNLSPLQFQKRLRLYEAERLMLQEGKNAGTAALMVGYESGSQFNREYKRQFGAPPHRDVTQKRA